ncbi:MAG TPA: PfkB family carbohydrate kinase [Ignavibacteria bacterium]|nr:PfkB family carbohydrate kinase [Ignavibacteria bacterium]HQY50809.1 PfkB family carbohydrate kinase [Ignavibacteria bacterium]HRB00118.1 PfkB family carbohydrate kinase [Ignavibacteria bacterium]
MSLLVIGSLALDTIETPFGKAERTLGGSATFISTSASYFTTPVRLVGIVGYDFPKEEIEFLKSKKIDISGLEISETKKTFHWHGKYDFDLNTRESLVTELNAFETFDPVISEKFKDSEYVCLGNLHPSLQKKVISQISKPKLVMCDTMNFWIEGAYNELLEILKHVNLLVINDSEARELTKEFNLVIAARKIMSLGPKILIIKKGEHGALLFTNDSIFSAPAYPLEEVFDPTGAGDTFAGGLMGWIAKTKDLSTDNLKLAVIYGSTMASLAVEKFSLDGIRNLTNDTIMKRFSEFKKLTFFKEQTL